MHSLILGEPRRMPVRPTSMRHQWVAASAASLMLVIGCSINTDEEPEKLSEEAGVVVAFPLPLGPAGP